MRFFSPCNQSCYKKNRARKNEFPFASKLENKCVVQTVKHTLSNVYFRETKYIRKENALK
jgi:hypothetical protein